MVPVRALYVPNGILFVHDAGRISVPEFENLPFYSNHSCVVMRAKHEQEGRCKVTLDATDRLTIGRQPNFVRPIRTPRRRVLVTLVPRLAVLAMSVAADVTFISIWTNDLIEPDDIAIGLGGGMVVVKRNGKKG